MLFLRKMIVKKYFGIIIYPKILIKTLEFKSSGFAKSSDEKSRFETMILMNF
jgi:hypothetical protein